MAGLAIEMLVGTKMRGVWLVFGERDRIAWTCMTHYSIHLWALTFAG